MVQLTDTEKTEELILFYFNNIREEIISQTSVHLTKKLKEANPERYHKIELKRGILANQLLLAQNKCISSCGQELEDCKISSPKHDLFDDYYRAVFANKQLIYTDIKSKNDKQGLGFLIEVNEYISTSGREVFKREIKNFNPIRTLEENVTQILQKKEGEKQEETPLTLELLKVWYLLKRVFEIALDPNHNRLLITIDFNDFYNLRDITLYFKNLGDIKENAFNVNYVRPGKYKMISLYSNEIRSINSHAFNNLHCLEVLNLDFNSLERIDPEWFKPLFNLKELYISENKLLSVGSKKFESLKNLEILTLFGSNNSFEYEKDMLHGLDNLKELKISGVKNIKSDIFENLSNLKRLYLDIRQKFIDDTIFKNLVNIEELLIQNNQTGIIKANFLPQQSKLKSLTMQDCTIGKVDPKAFSHLKQLENVYLLNVGLDHIEKNTFEGLDKLKKVDLSYNKFPERHIFGLNGVDESIVHNF